MEEAAVGAAHCRPEDPVFDRYWRLYSVCRERLFADHTETIAAALAPAIEGRAGARLLEVGCGPGFYARRMAAHFPDLQVMGVDMSERLLTHARRQARRDGLGNCCFSRADARTLGDAELEADAAITSRLFLVLTQPEQVIHAIHGTLRPGGLFFAAEPTSALRTAIPLWAMRLAELLHHGFRSSEWPVRCHVMGHDRFEALMRAEPWKRVKVWRDARYQYALCEKAS